MTAVVRPGEIATAAVHNHPALMHGSELFDAAEHGRLHRGRRMEHDGAPWSSRRPLRC